MMKKVATIVSLVIILTVTLAAFAPSLQNGFNYDDDIYIVNNRFIQTLSAFNLKKICTSFFAGNYQPVTILTYALEYRYFKLNPSGYHLTNLILHLLNCLLVFWLFYLLSARIPVAFFVSVFFALHPLRVESVAWISERKDLLYALFFLGALIAYVYYLKEKKRPGLYALTLFLFILSLLSKPMAVTLPILLVLLEYFISGKIKFLNKTPFILFSLFLGAVTLFSQGAVGLLKIGRFNAGDKLLNTAYALIFYLDKIFIPRNLACMYPLPADAARWWSGIAVVFLLLALILNRKKLSKDFIFGAVFFLAAVSVVLPAVFSGETFVSDRYTYIPSLGIGYLAACGILGVLESKISRFRPVKVALVMILILAAGTLTFLSRKQCQAWKDGVTLWSDVVAKYPGLAKAYNNRGVLLLEQKNYPAASVDFKKAIECNPKFIFAYLNLGDLYAETGKSGEAAAVLEQALKIEPANAEAYFNLGRLSSLANRQEEAIGFYSKAAEQGHFLSCYNLGMLYLKLDREEAAVRMFYRAIEIAPQDPSAYAALSAVFVRFGKSGEKRDLYQKAVKNNADYFSAYYYMGSLLLKSAKFDQAVNLFKRAVEIDPHSPEAYIGLGNAYLAAGKNKESLRALSRALAIKRDSAPKP